MRRREFTVDEIALISNNKIPVTTLCKLVQASAPTISKMREKLGITTVRGRHEGSSVPNQRRTIHCVCQNPKCKKEFDSIRSTPRKFCCHSCQQTAANVAAKGKGSRKIRNPNTPAYTRYSRIVHGLSQVAYEEHIDTINPNRYPRTLCGVEGGWQLDHIIPIKECFERGLSPEEASALTNLRMLPWKENLMRQFKK